jgi:hypothetical protein
VYFIKIPRLLPQRAIHTHTVANLLSLHELLAITLNFIQPSNRAIVNPELFTLNYFFDYQANDTMPLFLILSDLY